MKKVCTKCGIEKELEEFNKRASTKDGLATQCRKCAKEYQEKNKDKIKALKKRYRKENKEKIREYNKLYARKKAELIKERKARYRKENKEKIKEQRKIYYEKNKDKIKERYEKNKERYSEYKKEYRKRNKDKIKKWGEEYYKRDEVKLMRRISSHKRRVAIRKNGGSFSSEDWEEAMKFFGGRCAYSGEVLTTENESIEHVVPVSKGGTNNINNLIPCDKTINISKRAQDWEEWYPKQPFYSKEREKKIREWIELKTAISLFD